MDAGHEVSDIVYVLLAINAGVRERYWAGVGVILCYLITPISKQKTLRLQLSTAKIDVPAVWVGHFHAPLPMHAFA